MRLLSILFIALYLTPAVYAQSEDDLVGWFIDDFESTTFDQRWKEISGHWGLDGTNLVAKVANGAAVLTNETYVMRTKPYIIDAVIQGAGGGVLFCMENHDQVRDGHVVYFTGGAVSIGYFDHQGNYIETRTVPYMMPENKAVQLRVTVDPVNRRFTVSVFKRDIALEELRYLSGYFGVYAAQNNVSLDYFQVLGYNHPDSPTLFLKSNKTQIDHVSYISTMGEGLLIANPVVGVVQRTTSRGNFVSEYYIQGLNSKPRGMYANPKSWVYIVDGGQNAVRIYNANDQMELMFSEGLDDPRDVYADDAGANIYVLDVNAIKIFDPKGNLKDTKAAGLFKDPKSMWVSDGKFYVADYGNARVVVLDGGSFQIADEIKEDLVSPWGVFVDPESKDVYVADPGAAAVLQFDKNKTLVERIDPITIRGFVSPRSVCVLNEYVYVADLERILVFKKGVLSVRPTFRIDM